MRILATALFAALLAAGGATAADTPAVDPAAIAALEKMGGYLRSLGAFEIEATTSDEDVLEAGQKIQYSGASHQVAHLPGHLRAEVKNDRYERLSLYDGSQFTLYAPRPNWYATVAAPPGILDFADTLEQRYGLSVPLEDLFRWGSAGWKLPAQIKAVSQVGASVVEGTTCEQYAFRQDDVDWQLWIQRGDFPLPRKIVITDRTDEARPQHTAVYTWNLAPSFNDDVFVFHAPPGAQRATLPANPTKSDK